MVQRAIERPAPALVALVRDGVLDAMPTQPGADSPAAVAFVPHNAPRPLAGTPAPIPLDLALFHERLEHRLVMPLAGRYQQHQRFAVSVRSHMDLRAEPATAAAQGLASLTASGPGGVLVSAHDGAVDEVDRPI